MKFSVKNDIESISHVKSNFNKILDQLKSTQRPLVITQNGKSAGVLLDVESWEFILKKIALLKRVNEGEDSLKDSSPKSLKTIKQEFEKKYNF